MKITLLATGSRGDVQPYVALGLGLKERGHKVILAALENFKDFVEGYGLDYAPIAGDSRKLMEDPSVSGPILAGDNLGFFRAAKAGLKPILDRHLDDMRAASNGSDLVLSSPVTEFSGASAAEACGAKFALSYLVPMAPSAHYAPFPLGVSSLLVPPLNALCHWVAWETWWRFNQGELNQLRRRWGLAPLGRSSTSAHRQRRGLELYGFSPTLFPAPPDWSASQRVTGAWSLASGEAGPQGDAADPGFLQWLEDGSPPVYFGFGSMPVPGHLEFLEMAAELCEELGMRALIGAGWNDIDVKACDLPDNLAIVESVDHAWLFPQCAAVVHHGGAGTTHAGLAAGVPNVVCSFFADQPFWGSRVKKIGAGSAMRFQDMSYERLKRALGEAMDEGVAARAAEVGAAISAENGVLRACEAIEAEMKAP